MIVAKIKVNMTPVIEIEDCSLRKMMQERLSSQWVVNVTVHSRADIKHKKHPIKAE